MTTYNFMSGSSVDNASNFLYDAFLSEQCYIGMAKGNPDMQWGINALVMIECDTFPLSVAGASGVTEGEVSNTYKFFDSFSVTEVSGATSDNQVVTIGYVADTDTGFNAVQMLDSGDIGTLKLIYMGKNFASIQGLSKYYYNFMTPSTTGSYYLFHQKGDSQAAGPVVAAKIMNKTMITVPYYTSNCSLHAKATSASLFAPVVSSGLERTINFLGETNISGLSAPETLPIDSYLNDDPSVAIAHKSFLVSADEFALLDDQGSVILGGMEYVDENPYDSSAIYTEITTLGNSQKYVTFRYLFNDTEYQYIKLLVGTNVLNELGIWHEALPFDSTVPTSDSNPPALDVSYLKNPLLSTSIFDVNGFKQLVTADFDFVKEINNTIEEAEYIANGFSTEIISLVGAPSEHTGVVRTAVSNGDQIIELYDYNGFVVGDTISIPLNYANPSASGNSYVVSAVDYTNGSNSITLNTTVTLSVQIPSGWILSSDQSTVNAQLKVAKTKDKQKALKFGLYNVMITKEVDLTGADSPTEGIYRQLFISYKPADENGVTLTNPTYTGDNTLYGANFNVDEWTYDNGLILYLANKIPIYRKWANQNEEFKIII